MSRDNNAADAFVGLVIGLILAILVAILMHYLSCFRAYWRLLADDPDLYALTDGERGWFNVSAWAFLPETALLVGAIGAFAVSAMAGLLIGFIVLVALFALAVWLMSREESVRERSQDDDFYELREFQDPDI